LKQTTYIHKIVMHLIEVICPPDAVELGVAPDIAEHLDAMMNATPVLIRRGMLAGMVAYDIGALAYSPRRARRAHNLPSALAAAYFDSWLHGPTIVHRQLAKALMQLITLAYYEQPSVQQQIGYTPAAWIATVTKRRLHMYQDAISAGESRITAADPLRPGVNIKQQLAAT
jgi:hypothetical protein